MYNFLIRSNEKIRLNEMAEESGNVLLLLLLLQETTAIPSRKKNEVGVPEVGVSEEGDCCKIIFL